MSRPVLLLILISCAFVATLGVFWLPLPPSNHELLANFAKAQDVADQAVAAGGIPWWSPSFMMGGSPVTQSLWILSDAAMWLGARVAGPYAGTRLAALAILLLCPFTMYFFVRRLCPDSAWTPFACALAYLFSPPLLIRLGDAEHVNIVLSMALMPLLFRGVLVMLEKQTLLSAVQCAVAAALLVLAYAKPAVLLLPVLSVFALWAWGERSHFAVRDWKIFAVCGAAFLLLGALPNLPTMREMKFAAGFDFGPFAGWQTFYSSKSILSWIDRDAWLSATPPSAQSPVRSPSAYLGLVPVFCVAALFFLRRRALWDTREAMVFRLFVALALLAQWFGFGVHNAIGAHLAWLKDSGAAPNVVPALAWGLLVLQGVVIFMITPGSLPGRRWWAGLALVVYFVVPGFRLIEKFPLFGGIRAPHDFFEIGGAFCVAVAAGVAACLIVRELPGSRRIAAAVALLLVAALDGALAVPSFFQPALSRAAFDDFLAAQNFLRGAPEAGRVMPYSGRYFYLLTPRLSGRGLATEAFNNYLTPRPIAELQAASMRSSAAFRSFLKAAGITFLLIDKTDPDTPPEIQKWLHTIGQPAFENSHFAVLKVPGSYAPAAFATDFSVVDAAADGAAAEALTAAGDNLAAIGGRTNFGDHLGQVDPHETPKHTPMQTLSDVRRPNGALFEIGAPAGPGWLLIPEAWHPDWRALQNGVPLEVARAFHGFLAVRLPEGTAGPVTVAFVPPPWYLACFLVSAASWLAAGIFLLAGRMAWLPAHWLHTTRELHPVSAPVAQAAPTALFAERTPPSRPLVVIPTYNEAAGIARTMDLALGSDPSIEVLVVDDGSPDGTAAAVKSHPAFRSRLHLVEREGKLGLGSAYKCGFDWALERGFDACIEMDADLSHDPADIPKLLAGLADGADAAIGSRYIGGVRVMNWPQDRLFLSLGASKFVRAITGLPLTDATSGFKALRSEALRALDWNRFTAQGYGFQVELHYFLWKSGAHLVEVPITFTERREGKTKMTPGIAVEAFRRVLRLALFGK